MDNPQSPIFPSAPNGAVSAGGGVPPYLAKYDRKPSFSKSFFKSLNLILLGAIMSIFSCFSIFLSTAFAEEYKDGQTACAVIKYTTEQVVNVNTSETATVFKALYICAVVNEYGVIKEKIDGVEGSGKVINELESISTKPLRKLKITDNQDDNNNTYEVSYEKWTTENGGPYKRVYTKYIVGGTKLKDLAQSIYDELPEKVQVTNSSEDIWTKASEVIIQTDSKDVDLITKKDSSIIQDDDENSMVKYCKEKLTLGWVICPILNALAEAIDAIDNWINEMF